MEGSQWGKCLIRCCRSMKRFIRRQHLFFVVSAPLSAEGHVNLSPKGEDALRILLPNEVAYLDLTGSANETAARQPGRLAVVVR